MLPLRVFQRIKPLFPQRGNCGLRRFGADPGAAPGAELRRNDTLVQIENPYKEPEKRCILCNVTVDYKNIQLLSQFISPHTGRIYGRHITGLCGRKQKEISKAIKKAHSMGFMSVTHKHPQFMRDPKVCGVKLLD
ncbi:small ribosomal subunit protein bS18m [Mastacembelus armatus]|uniref:Small ribosomal subunit protein bS18m n=1 Tax=Mastacembelus armatus TaxID=205130 RepID=A0A7N8WZG1_9TELE|nr:28S ribosomal protein S18c, mitochondrial [Mastacembelus armatus]